MINHPAVRPPMPTFCPTQSRSPSRRAVAVLAIATTVLAIASVSPPDAGAKPRGGKTSLVKCELPATLDGLRLYGPEGVEDLLTRGPSAIAVDSDRSFWIADAVNKRLLHVAENCDVIGAFPVAGAISIDAIAVAADEIAVLDEAATPPAVITVSRDGVELSRVPVPDSGQTGLSGLRDAGDGTLLLEYEGGARFARLDGANATASTAKASASLVRHGHELRVESGKPEAGAMPKRATVTIDGAAIAVSTENSLGGISAISIDSAGRAQVVTDEVSFMTPEVKVDRRVLSVSAAGKISQARVPIRANHVAVRNDVAVGPDGSVWSLTTRPNSIQIRKMRFVRALRPILDKGVAKDIAIGASSSTSSMIGAAATCRTRTQMTDVAKAYLNNSTYLSSASITSTCSGRTKPSYLGSAGTYSSMSYKWGGFDSVSQFNSASSLAAGDTDTQNDGLVLSCARGVDCSGYVSRTWGLTTKQNVGGLFGSYSCSSPATLLPGDIFAKTGKGGHVVMFSSNATNGVNVYEAVYVPGKVKTSFYSWSGLSGYYRARACNVCS